MFEIRYLVFTRLDGEPTEGIQTLERVLKAMKVGHPGAGITSGQVVVRRARGSRKVTRVKSGDLRPQKAGASTGLKTRFTGPKDGGRPLSASLAERSRHAGRSVVAVELATAEVVAEPVAQKPTTAEVEMQLTRSLVEFLATDRGRIVGVANRSLFAFGAAKYISSGDLSWADDVVQIACERMLRKIIPEIACGQRKIDLKKKGGIARYFFGVVRFDAREFMKRQGTHYGHLHYIGNHAESEYDVYPGIEHRNWWSQVSQWDLEIRMYFSMLYNYIFSDGKIGGMTIVQRHFTTTPRKDSPENIEAYRARLKAFQMYLEGSRYAEIVHLMYDADTVETEGIDTLCARVRQHIQRLKREILTLLEN